MNRRLTAAWTVRVGLEASAGLSHRFTGVQRYIAELTGALADLHRANLDCRLLFQLGFYRKRRLMPVYRWPVRWYLAGPWPLVPRCDVLHGLAVRLPRAVSRAARVVTLHDLFALTLPELSSRRGVRKAVDRYRTAARVCDRIIAVSEATRREFLKHFDFPEDKIHVVPHGISNVFLEAAETNIRQQPSDTAAPLYFVAYGGGRRKNLARVIRAFARSERREIMQLRVVGPMDADAVIAVRETKLADRVVPIDAASDDELVHLYRHSAGLLYPSLQEGFGLPILEAMACGAPILTSASGATAETAGGHAVLVDPSSVDSLTAGIDALAHLSERRLADASRYARQFTWRRAAERTLAVYEAAAA